MAALSLVAGSVSLRNLRRTCLVLSSIAILGLWGCLHMMLKYASRLHSELSPYSHVREAPERIRTKCMACAHCGRRPDLHMDQKFFWVRNLPVPALLSRARLPRRTRWWGATTPLSVCESSPQGVKSPVRHPVWMRHEFGLSWMAADWNHGMVGKDGSCN